MTNWTISDPCNGSTIVMTADSLYGSAVTSLTWDGVQFLNSTDDGRLWQTAIQYDGQGEANNPTEGGSSGVPGTTQILQESTLSPSQLATTIEMQMFGEAQPAELTKLETQYLPGQIEWAVICGYNPTVYAAQALGLALAGGDGTSNAFAMNYGNLTVPQFASEVSSLTGISAAAITGWVNNWFAFYAANPSATYGLPISLATYGAAFGDAAGNELVGNPTLNNPAGDNVLTASVMAGLWEPIGGSYTSNTEFTKTITINWQNIPCLIDDYITVTPGSYESSAALEILTTYLPGSFSNLISFNPATEVATALTPTLGATILSDSNGREAMIAAVSNQYAIGIWSANPSVEMLAIPDLGGSGTMKLDAWTSLSNLSASVPHSYDVVVAVGTLSQVETAIHAAWLL